MLLQNRPVFFSISKCTQKHQSIDKKKHTVKNKRLTFRWFWVSSVEKRVQNMPCICWNIFANEIFKVEPENLDSPFIRISIASIVIIWPTRANGNDKKN